MDSVKWDSPPSFLARPARAAERILLNQSSLADAVQQDVVKAGLVAQPDALQAGAPAVSQPENRSVLRLSGELATRPLLDQPELPVLTHLGGLRPTVVRLGVGWDGRVQHALLERTSGDSAADATALEIIRQVGFEVTTRLDPEQPTWGVATFYWATVPPVPAAEAATESAP